MNSGVRELGSLVSADIGKTFIFVDTTKPHDPCWHPSNFIPREITHFSARDGRFLTCINENPPFQRFPSEWLIQEVEEES